MDGGHAMYANKQILDELVKKKMFHWGRQLGMYLVYM